MTPRRACCRSGSYSLESLNDISVIDPLKNVKNETKDVLNVWTTCGVAVILVHGIDWWFLLYGINFNSESYI